MKKRHARCDRPDRLVLRSVLLLGALALGLTACGRPSPDMPDLPSVAAHGAESFATVTAEITSPAPPGTASDLTWAWEYDDEDRLTAMVGPGGVTTRVAYGQAPPAPASPEGGARRVFARDVLGRLVKVGGDDDEMSFLYHDTGLPAEVRSSSGPALRYSYDVEGRLGEMGIGGSSIRYRYDYLGRLLAIETPAGPITYGYHLGSGTVTRGLPNGVRTLWVQDDEGRLTELTHVDPSDHVIAKYTYTYRPDGLIERIVEQTRRGDRDCSYAYDLMKRLTAVECRGGGHSYVYTFDGLGNLAGSSTSGGPELAFESTPGGALASDSRGTARVDARGHVREVPGPDGSIEYDFDPWGSLDGADGEAVRYAYNPLGQLTQRATASGTTSFLPDPFADAWRPLWWTDADGSEALIVWDGATPLMEIRGGQATYRLEDHLASARIGLDAGGDIEAWYDYSPFGVREGDGSAGEIAPGFAGLYWDEAARIYHAGARAYDPVTGRFLQPDPVLRVPRASKLSHSLYAYSGGDPVNYIDRNGAQASMGKGSTWLWQWHLGRNEGNVQPVGELRPTEEAGSWSSRIFDYSESGNNRYVDQAGRIWHLVPDSENIFHPAGDVRATSFVSFLIDASVLGDLFGRWDPSGYEGYKTYKFVSHDGLGSHEAIYVPGRGARFFKDGYWRTNGSGQGTRNLVRHGGFFRNVGDLRQPPVVMLGRLALDLAHMAVDGAPGLMAQGRYLHESPNIPYGSVEHPTIQRQTRTLSTHMSYRSRVVEGIQQRYDMLVVPPGGPGGGGSALPGANPSLGRYGSISNLAPSPVGGVYLGGGAAALEGLGELQGVAIDEATGRLVLLGSGDERMELPPLRLEDIVTVFRAVYREGRSPSVTIDPDERNPKGPIMHVRHGPGTERTYVGWILFEADRIMKTYQLGVDNVTRAPVRSTVPEHAATIDRVFFGDTADEDAESSWERFWIVPAAVSRFDGSVGDLSLFELPLKVNTQRMRWEDGELVDDEDGQSSPGALAFTQWFTQHYDEIADEVRLTPPAGSGRDAPVAVFHELRRIAMIAAVAERLRDLGQSMPLWMRDYEVPPFPVAETTPSLTIEKTKPDGSNLWTSTIYGGVNLAPADRDVHAFTEVQLADPQTIPSEDLAFVRRSSEVAQSIRPEITRLRTESPLGQAASLPVSGGPPMTATSIPGAGFRALAANRRTVTDMSVPTGAGAKIELTRHYSSFVDPEGGLGRGWTLDLPRLEMNSEPVTRDGRRSEYRSVPHLISPLGTVDVRFDRRRVVEPWGVELPVADGHPEMAGVGRGRSEILGADTQRVLFRNGAAWHFDDDGRLLLIERRGTATRYVRDGEGRVRQIVGYVGTDALAEITLEIDGDGRFIEARATRAAQLGGPAPGAVTRLRFSYDEEGRLVEVVAPEARSSAPVLHRYSYEDGRLAGMWSGDLDLSFRYDARGRLLGETRNGRGIEYTLGEGERGTSLTGRGEGGGWRRDYDPSMRPTALDRGDGNVVRWVYRADGEIVETLSADGRAVLERTTSPDGRTQTTRLNGGLAYEVSRDPFHRPTRVAVGGRPAASLSWRSDGSLESLRTATGTVVEPRRHADGWQNGVSIRSVSSTTAWTTQTSDIMGRPTAIADASGFEYRMRYDDRGRLSSYGRVTEDGRLVGARLGYDSAGRVTDVASSWGNERREYGAGGVLRRVSVDRLGRSSVATFDSLGRKTRETSFEGATTTWRYDSEVPGTAPRAIELADRQHIEIASTRSGERSAEEARLDQVEVRSERDAEGRIVRLTWSARGR